MHTTTRLEGQQVVIKVFKLGMGIVVRCCKALDTRSSTTSVIHLVLEVLPTICPQGIMHVVCGLDLSGVSGSDEVFTSFETWSFKLILVNSFAGTGSYKANQKG